MLLKAFSLPLLAALVSAHAHMTVPLPWLGNGFANAANCNAGTATAPKVTLTAGATASITWVIQASDGSGPVTLSLDPAGGVNFNTPLAVTKGDANPNRVNTPYVFEFTVPAAQCNTAKGCTIRAKSSSNWVSCVSVNIAAKDAPPAAPPTPTPTKTPAATSSPSASYIPPAPSASSKPTKSPGASAFPSTTASAKPSASYVPRTPALEPTDGDDSQAECVTPTDLSLCKAINGKSVQLNIGMFPGAGAFTPLQFEQNFVQKTYDQEYNNPLVFAKAGNASCTSTYLPFLCSRMFLSCGETAPTLSSCQALKSQCQPANEHAFLYNCSDPTVASGTAKLDSYPQTVVDPGAGATDPSITDPTTDEPTTTTPKASKSPKVTQQSSAERVSVAVSAGALVAVAFFAL